MRKLLFLAIIMIAFSSCDNYRARKLGGTETVTLEPNERFINITWKESNLWIITEDTLSGTYYAREKSNLGVWEGKIIIKSLPK